MSEKPQGTPADVQEDLIEQIITQGLEKINAPAQTATEEAPGSEAPTAPKPDGEAAHPADRKKRPSAVYLYLLTLFGAAFLMLLLAYFVQRRSNESAINDLRNSTNISQEELLARIRELEEKNEGLNIQLSILQQRYDAKERSANDIVNQLTHNSQEALYSWESFWLLESHYQAGDILICGVILFNQTQVFNNFTYSTPRAVQKRYDEIVRAVVDAGILDEDYKHHLEDYQWMQEVLF